MKTGTPITTPTNNRQPQNLGSVLPGYKINEYLLVLQPHEDLWNKIQKVKNEFADKFKAEQARWSKPHVTLATFVQYQMQEARLINRLNIIAMGCPPAKIELKDFGSFPSHSIYINITSKLPIQNLVKNIRTDAQRLMKLNDDNKPYFISEPHLTIARKLQPWQYEKGWLEYSHKSFTGRFIADSMLLLKRPVDGTAYEIVQRFEFKNLPVNTTQGELFS